MNQPMRGQGISTRYNNCFSRDHPLKCCFYTAVIHTRASVLLEFFRSFSPLITLAVNASQRRLTSSVPVLTMTTSLLIDSSWHTPIKDSDEERKFWYTGLRFSRSSLSACQENSKSIQFHFTRRTSPELSKLIHSNFVSCTCSSNFRVQG